VLKEATIKEDDMDVEEDQLYARQQLQKAISAIPQKLLDKESLIAQKLEFSNLRPIKKLKVLYDLVDSISAHLGRFSACKKGCNSCCHYPVSILQIEADYIEKFENKKQKNKAEKKTTLEGSACPFLKNGSCSIYKSRPFACRTHFTFTKDAKWCSEEVANTHEFARAELSEARRALFGIAAEHGSSQPLEIRNIFTS
tara:strand:- start:3766 stop:4359 length:594 start_codon:yes stop_codon:yes gene_type:complete